MEWWLALLIIMGCLFILFALGTPIAFSFLIVNIIGVLLFWGGPSGLSQLVLSIRGSIATFVVLPLILFMLMGTVLFQSGMGILAIDAIDKWMGRLPGRLGLLAVGSGVLLATLTGTSMASGAILGKALTPEMEKRGYKKAMSLGPILGSGGLAVLIPPSGIAVLVAAIAETSVADVLIGGIVPGLLMATFYALYIILRCWYQPSIAPPYDIARLPLHEKTVLFLKYILPLGAIIFLVTGIIFLGIATPSEAGASGALGSFILALCYRKLNRQVIKKTFAQALSVSTMMLMIITGAVAFSQILSFSGATIGLTNTIGGLPISPILIIISLQVVLIFLGMFAGQVAMIMVIVPLFMPIIEAFGMSPVWFCLLIILNVEMSATSPPYGLLLFVMKGVAPPDTKMSDLYRAAIPFLACDLIVMALMIAFPNVVLYLPSLMH
ncbi:MAG: TRAP transporter large permease subunit [Desulfatiglandales bacterium]|nr:TRAP transporter large permease subunit [Desulfatiglandales bacterium]